MPSASASEDPWLLARNQYMRDLNEEEQIIFETASLENLLDSVSAAQKNHEEESKCRAISRKMGPFVNAICQFGEALDVYSNTYAIAMAPLWGSVRVLLHVVPPCFHLKAQFANLLQYQIAKEFQKYFKNLIDMLSRIGDNLPRCRIYQTLFPSHGRLLQAVSVVYLDIIEFCMDAKTTFRRLKKSKISKI